MGLSHVTEQTSPGVPSTDPHQWSDHGGGIGPLDGIEDWGHAVGEHYLSVRVEGGGGGAHWMIRRQDSYQAPWPVVAEGDRETVESAGLACVEALVQLA